MDIIDMAVQKTITYPQYRKYKHERTYFKIISKDEWEEIHILSKHTSIHHFKATILPDRNYIYDLTFDYKKNWLMIDENEYEEIKKRKKITYVIQAENKKSVP